MEYFGAIVAADTGMECLRIDRPDQVIELYERIILKDELKEEYLKLLMTMETKYSFLKKRPFNFFQ